MREESELQLKPVSESKVSGRNQMPQIYQWMDTHVHQRQTLMLS